MKIDLILQIITILITVIGVLITIILPLITFSKKKKIKKISDKIQEIYSIYIDLNPYLFGSSNKKCEIEYDFRSQGISYYLVPIKNRFLCNEREPFDLLEIYDVDAYKKISFKEINIFLERWNILLAKINNVKNTIDKFMYIVKETKTNHVWYNLQNTVSIDKTSISFCPTFDYLKLFKWKSRTFLNPKIIKHNLKQNYKKQKEEEFVNELKSNFFSINIIFEEKYKINNNFSYSIYFENGFPSKLDTFYNSQEKLSWDDLEKRIVCRHFEWINNIFKTKFEFKYFDIHEHFNKIK